MKRKVAIFGAGNGGKCLKECLEMMGECEIVCFIDDDASKNVFEGLPVIDRKRIPGLKTKGVSAVACEIANSKFRLELRNELQKLGIEYLSVIHPMSFISPSAKIGEGCFVKAGAIIETNSLVGNCCIIDNGAIIPHDNVVKDGCHLAPGVSLGSSIVIGERSVIGIGVSVATGIKIGKNVIISVGSSVVTDIPDNVVVQGVPGRIIGKRR